MRDYHLAACFRRHALGDLRAVLARFEASAPRLREVLDAQAHETGPTPPQGRG